MSYELLLYRLSRIYKLTRTWTLRKMKSSSFIKLIQIPQIKNGVDCIYPGLRSYYILDTDIKLKLSEKQCYYQINQ
jgi:hypothetical protein